MSSSTPYIISIGSCKGGVGKSTCALLCAMALTSTYAVGLLDADLYGSSLLDICGAGDTKSLTLEPISVGPLDILSFAPLKDRETPLVWRAPLLHKALLSMLNPSLWKHKDIIIVDLPPGTGDTALTLMQKSPLLGHILVSTPHPLSVRESILFANLCKTMHIPLLGTLLNMVDLHEPNTELKTLEAVSPCLERIAYNRSLSAQTCKSTFLEFCAQHMPKTLQNIYKALHPRITHHAKQLTA